MSVIIVTHSSNPSTSRALCVNRIFKRQIFNHTKVFQIFRVYLVPEQRIFLTTWRNSDLAYYSEKRTPGLIKIAFQTEQKASRRVDLDLPNDGHCAMFGRQYLPKRARQLAIAKVEGRKNQAKPK